MIEARGDDSLPGRLNPSAAPRYERRHSGIRKLRRSVTRRKAPLALHCEGWRLPDSI